MRRLFLALVLACSGLVLIGPPAAYACSCAPMKFGEQVDRADAVVAGTLERVEESDASVAPDGTRVYVVQVDHLYKGEDVPATVEVSTPASSSACGLDGLEIGTAYAFLLLGSDGSFEANNCMGAPELTPAVEKRLVKRLGDGSPVDEPEPAELTAVDDSEPRAFRTLAAPGGALVIVGLLGLVLVRALGRGR